MRLKYLVPLIFSILGFSIFSQPPIWPMATITSVGGVQMQIPLYSTELVYQVNVSQSAAIQFVQVTVPESILQQQLQYCKTYDPFITNISLLQCAFAYPAMAIVYNPLSGSQVGYEVSYFIVPISYDNVTGLPNTFQIFLNNHIGNLSSGIYYVYLLYPSPYYLSYESLFNSQNMPACPTSLTYAASYNFNGGWCSDTGGFGNYFQPNSYPYYGYPYAQTLYYNGNGIFSTNITRYLFVTFNPQYPVLIGYLFGWNGFAYVYTDIYVIVRNPSTGVTQTIYIPEYSSSGLYDLRMIELNQGLDPYQWNEIIAIRSYTYELSTTNFASAYLYGFYLQYVPQ